MDWFKLEDIAVSLYFVACEHACACLALGSRPDVGNLFCCI